MYILYRHLLDGKVTRFLVLKKNIVLYEQQEKGEAILFVGFLSPFYVDMDVQMCFLINYKVDE